MTGLTSQLQKARAVLQALAHGLHPVTGDELPEQDIVNDVDVTRAISMAVLALDQMTTRLIRRQALPEKVGMGWAEKEVQQLKDEFNGHESLSVIAKKHGRTVRAIEARLESLGLLRANQRTTKGGYAVLPARQEEGK